jgi:hypothetical protein
MALVRVRERAGIQGVDELIATMRDLTRPTQRNALRRTAKDAMAPLADAVKAKSPVKWGDLEESLTVGTKLTPRQRSLNRPFVKSMENYFELHFGTSDPAGMMEEFQLGNSTNSAPFFRPEWEARKRSMRDAVANDLWTNIKAAGERAYRKRKRKGL